MQYQELKFLRNFDSKTYPIIVTCCFFLIVSYVAFFHHNYWLDGDYLLYSDWGYDILSGNSKNVKLINTPSIGSVIFASLNSFTGDEFLTAKLISVFSGTGIVFFSYYIIKNIFNSKIALLGQLFVAFSPRIDSLSIRTINEVIPAFLIFAAFFFITKKQLNISSVIISGAILGIAFMFRYQPILVLGAFVIFLLIRDKKIRINLLYALTMLLFFLAAASPVFFYNYSIHGTLIDSNPDYEYAFRSNYMNTELLTSFKQNIADNGSTIIFSDFDLFMKNYFYNLFYYNPNKLFNFNFTANISTIPAIPLLGLILFSTALMHLLKIQLDKKNLIVLIGVFFSTLFSVLLFGDITIHFFALFIMPIIGLAVLNFKKINTNLQPMLIALAIFLPIISIIPLVRPEHFLPIWIVFPTLSAVFFVEVIPKIITKTIKTSHNKQKFSLGIKISLVLLFLIFILNFFHSYKSIENHLYEGEFTNIMDEFFNLFKQNESRQPSGIEYKEIGDFLSTQPGIEDSYVMTSQVLITHYANSKRLFASFEEGPENDTIENYITRKNWSDYQRFFSDNTSHPSDMSGNYNPIPDYLVYIPHDLYPRSENNTQYEDLKILSDPQNPKIPSNFRAIFIQNQTGIVIYKIINNYNNRQ